MSVVDVIENAKVWLAAIAEKERLEDSFRGAGGMSVYREWCEAIEAEKKAARAHLASVIDLPNDGEHDDARIARLRTENGRLAEQVKKLKTELTQARENNEERNRELDALHYVWCSGGCHGGVHRYCGAPDDITEEVVAAAVRNTERLQSWFANRQYRKSRESTP
jgi:predicted nuclease with TOPRIM domain